METCLHLLLYALCPRSYTAKDYVCVTSGGSFLLHPCILLWPRWFRMFQCWSQSFLIRYKVLKPQTLIGGNTSTLDFPQPFRQSLPICFFSIKVQLSVRWCKMSSYIIWRSNTYQQCPLDCFGETIWFSMSFNCLCASQLSFGKQTIRLVKMH